jgi:hypothetical protein
MPKYAEHKKHANGDDQQHYQMDGLKQSFKHRLASRN